MPMAPAAPGRLASTIGCFSARSSGATSSSGGTDGNRKFIVSSLLSYCRMSNPAAADLLDHGAIVPIAFALADTGLQNLRVNLSQRQGLTATRRLILHQVDVFQRLADTALRRLIAGHHLFPLHS